MNAIRVQGDRQINSIVNSDSRAQGASNRDRRFCFTIELTRKEVLLAQLNQPCPTGDQPRYLFGMRESRDPDVCDGIKFVREREHFLTALNSCSHERYTLRLTLVPYEAAHSLAVPVFAIEYFVA